MEEWNDGFKNKKSLNTHGALAPHMRSISLDPLFQHSIIPITQGLFPFFTADGLREVFRTILRLFSALAVNELEIASVDKDAGTLPHDEYRVSPVDGIGKQSHSPGQTKIPEVDGNYAAAVALAVNPLNQKAHCKSGLTYKSYDQPNVVSSQDFLPPRSQEFCFAVATTSLQIDLRDQPKGGPKRHNWCVHACVVGD
jgi:hypothetical protein